MSMYLNLPELLFQVPLLLGLPVGRLPVVLGRQLVLRLKHRLKHPLKTGIFVQILNTYVVVAEGPYRLLLRPHLLLQPGRVGRPRPRGRRLRRDQRRLLRRQALLLLLAPKGVDKFCSRFVAVQAE